MMRRRPVIRQTNKAHNLPKRNFYTATSHHLKPLPARVKRTEQGTWELETYERHQEQEAIRAAVHTGKPISRNNTFTWERKFHIDAKNGTMVRGENIFLSSKYILAPRHNSLFIPWKEDEYFPDLLYAIPQVTWNEFIAKLPHQYIVKKLNLFIHRHLWKEHNFIVLTENEKLKNTRLEAISSYHFLYQPYMDTGRIDAGEPTLQALKKAGFSEQLANKLAHCHSSSYVLLLKSYAEVKATTNKILNKEKFDEIVAAIPSSQTSPVEFAKMLDDALVIDRTHLHHKAKANFFYHARRHFGHFRSVKFSSDEFRDYISSIVRDLIFPGYLRSLESTPADSPRDQIALDDRERNLKFELEVMLTEMHTPEKLQQLLTRWHRNMTVIESKKPLEIVSSNWHALFERQIIDDINFECLTTAEELYKEGQDMHHCVGGYKKDCRTGGTHIVRIQSLTGERSTLSICIKVKNNKHVFEIGQHYGMSNESADPRHSVAVEQLMKKLNAGEIPVNQSFGAITRDGVKLELMHLYYPYDLKDPSVAKQIYEAYRKAKVLPPIFDAESHEKILPIIKLYR